MLRMLSPSDACCLYEPFRLVYGSTTFCEVVRSVSRPESMLPLIDD